MRLPGQAVIQLDDGGSFISVRHPWTPASGELKTAWVSSLREYGSCLSVGTFGLIIFTIYFGKAESPDDHHTIYRSARRC